MERLLENKGEQLSGKGTGSYRVWPVVPLMVLLGGEAVAWMLPPSGRGLFHHCQSMDPTLSTSSLSLVWALLAWIPARVLAGFSLPGEMESVLIPLVVVALAVRHCPLNAFCFLFWTAVLGSVSGGFLQITGTDALVYLLFSSLVHPRFLSERQSDPLQLIALGFLMGEGWVYPAGFAFLFVAARRRSPRSVPIFDGSRVFLMAAGVGLNLLFFTLLRVRYPHPDLVSEIPPLAGFVQQWLGKGGVLQWGDLHGWIREITEFSGLFGGVLFFLSRMTSLFLKGVWRASAGRTVPAQIVLYSLVLVPVTAGVWKTFPDRGEREVSVSTLSRKLRTLVAKSPTGSSFLLPSNSFGVMQLLSLKEEVGDPPSIGVVSSDDRGLTRESRPSSKKPEFRSNPLIEYDGKNVVRIFGEPLRFEPQYLMSATTEVWAATPHFFVANNPALATDQPELRYEGWPLSPETRHRLNVRDWNYSGKGFFVFRVRGEAPWSFPQGEWQVDYRGYILSEEFRQLGERRRPRQRVPLSHYF